MSLTSTPFILFFILVSGIYFVLPYRYRWIWLLGSSYYFYITWEPASLLLLAGSTFVTYVCALQINKESFQNIRKRYFILCIAFNLGLLFIFKYFLFFYRSLRDLGGQSLPPLLFTLLLPVGISFYTFKSISYCADVYRGEQKAEKHLGRVALYVAFFPQLLAGPIERGTRLLPQFHQWFHFDSTRAAEGLRRVLWGFFQKMVIADNLAILVDSVYNHPESHQGINFLLATFFYSFQIYCDFSGYSEIAIGSAQVLGYRTMENFDRPYFSTSVREFWRRWHISLSTWLRDYLYIPLGGSRVPEIRWYLNLFIVFLICGLWHGANWTFVFWGGIHGLYLIFSAITQTLRNRVTQVLGLRRIPEVHRMFKIGMTFLMVSFAWIFFRANSLSDAFYIIQRLWRGWGELFQSQLQMIPFMGALRFEGMVGICSLFLLVVVEGMRGNRNFSQMIATKSRWLRWSVYYVLILSILFFGQFGGQPFIYFQF